MKAMVHLGECQSAGDSEASGEGMEKHTSKINRSNMVQYGPSFHPAICRSGPRLLGQFTHSKFNGDL